MLGKEDLRILKGGRKSSHPIFFDTPWEIFGEHDPAANAPSSKR